MDELFEELNSFCSSNNIAPFALENGRFRCGPIMLMFDEEQPENIAYWTAVFDGKVHGGEKFDTIEDVCDWLLRMREHVYYLMDMLQDDKVKK